MVKRDNKSGNAKRSKNRSHGKVKSARAAIRDEIKNCHGPFWKTKYNLAAKISSEYEMPIGDANHLIEQEGRRIGARVIGSGCDG